MVKIGVDIQPLQSDATKYRGIGRYVSAVLERLLKLNASAYNFEFWANSNLSEPILEHDNNPVRWLEYPDLNESLPNRLCFDTNLMFSDCDAFFLPNILEGHDIVSPTLNAISKPTFAICYDLIPLVFPEKYLRHPDEHDRYMRRVDCLSRVDTIFAISEATRRDVIRLLEIEPERVVNISSGVSPFFRPLPTSERQTWGEHISSKFGIHQPFVLYTGGEDWRKNLVGLVRSFACLPASLRESYKLVIACKLSKVGLEALNQEAQEYGVSSQVILTNFVSDEELRALYRLCSLFVFPSLYEGFGLPLLEAMSCGAPSIAGNNSSLIEILGDSDLLFDASNTDATARIMEKLLCNDDYRNHIGIAAVARARSFSWDKVASRIEATLSSTLSSSNDRTYSDDKESAPRRRTQNRIAMFSPLPPQETGISDYTTCLLPELALLMDIDVYHDEGYKPNCEINARCPGLRTISIKRFEKKLQSHPYHALVYQMGDNHFHIEQFELMLRYGGITVLHDYQLSGLIQTTQEKKPELNVTFKGELQHSFGTARTEEILEQIQRPGSGAVTWDEFGIFVNRRIFTRSLGVIVHNDWAYRKAVEDFSKDCAFIQKIPLATPPIAIDVTSRNAICARLQIPKDAVIISTFGFVARTKRPMAVLKAFKQFLARHPNAYLVFVGQDKLDKTVETPLEELVRKYGLNGNVYITGFVSMQEFRQFIQASDICLNLRYPYHGETSAALLQLLSYGKPTIVTDIGSFSELPDNVVFKVPIPSIESEDQQIYQALEYLTVHKDFREAMGQNATRHVEMEHSPKHCADLYAQFINEVMASPLSKRKLMADCIGREMSGYQGNDLKMRFQEHARLIDQCAAKYAVGHLS